MDCFVKHLRRPRLPSCCSVTSEPIQCSGTLDAGGFEFLFNADGEPHDNLILQAYDAIGAAKGKKALEAAFKVFEGGVPPKDQKERMQKWNSRSTDVNPDEIYSTARAEVRTMLDEYAHKHQKEWRTSP